MDEDQMHAAQLASVRAALAGYLLHLRASGVDCDSIAVTVTDGGEVEIRADRAGIPVFGEGL
jgi:hypothetical protein